MVAMPCSTINISLCLWGWLQLKNFETINAVQLVPDEWTVESGLVTAAQKLQRSKLYQKYAKLIEVLFHVVDK